MTSEFKHGTRFQESKESQRSNDCDALGFDKFQGGTKHGSDEGGVTGSELAKICQQCHMSVMGCNKEP